MLSKEKLDIKFILLFIASAALFGFIYIEHKWFFVLIDHLTKLDWVSPGIKSFFYDRTQREIFDELISPIRGILLTLSLLTVISILFTDIIQREKSLETKGSFPYIKAMALFIIIAILVTPTKLGGSALEYANTSVVLFTKIYPINNLERLLLPALAHLMFFRGDGFYLIFALLWNFVLICALLFWLVQNKITMPFWALVSLASSSFIIFQFMVPGYPDVLVGIFVILALALPLSDVGLTALFTLSLISHEGSIFIWAGLIIIFFKRIYWPKFFIIVVLYIFMRFLGTGFDLNTLFLPRVVGEMTTIEWLKYNPDKLLFGIFFAFKSGWIIIGLGIYQWFQKREWKILTSAFVLLGIGGVLAVYGIDTSRLVGWIFPVLLLAWKELESPLSKSINRIATLAKVLNLLIPPIYVGLNGIVFPPGLYKLVYDLLFSWLFV